MKSATDLVTTLHESIRFVGLLSGCFDPTRLAYFMHCEIELEYAFRFYKVHQYDLNLVRKPEPV